MKKYLLTLALAVGLLIPATAQAAWLSPLDMNKGAHRLLNKILVGADELDGHIVACRKVSSTVGVCSAVQRSNSDYGVMLCTFRIRVVARGNMVYSNAFGANCQYEQGGE